MNYFQKETSSFRTPEGRNECRFSAGQEDQCPGYLGLSSLPFSVSLAPISLEPSSPPTSLKKQNLFLNTRNSGGKKKKKKGIIIHLKQCLCHLSAWLAAELCEPNNFKRRVSSKTLSPGLGYHGQVSDCVVSGLSHGYLFSFLSKWKYDSYLPLLYLEYPSAWEWDTVG